MEGKLSFYEAVIELFKVFLEFWRTTFTFAGEVLRNDKVLIPILVFIILVVGFYYYGVDAKDIILTGLGYLAGATQGNRTARATDTPTNGTTNGGGKTL